MSPSSAQVLSCRAVELIRAPCPRESGGVASRQTLTFAQYPAQSQRLLQHPEPVYNSTHKDRSVISSPRTGWGPWGRREHAEDTSVV